MDGTQLTHRVDDTEAVFEQRMRAYELQTEPVIAHYRGLGRFAEVNGEGAVGEVTVRLAEAIARLRGNDGGPCR
jgi:adenylate kinase